MNQKQLEEYIELSSIPIRSVDQDGIPTGIASACIINYEGKRILLTVYHATGNMANWGIQVRYEPNRGTAIQPLGAMNFLTSINVQTNVVRDIDFAYVEIPYDIAPISQIIDPISDSVISEKKRLDSNIDFNIHPNNSEFYGFSGQVMPELAGNCLITELRTYTKLKFIGDEEDYYVFELPFQHPGHEHFKGCSGAPIIDTKGNLVALVCKGDITTNRVYGVSLKKYEVAINATYGELSRIT